MRADDEQRPIDAAIARLRETYTPGAGRPSEDVESTNTNSLQDEHEFSVIPAEELLWPPPGMEAMHGQLPRIAFEFAIISFLLLGALRWTGTAATAVLMVGFLLACFGYARVRQLMLHASNAIAFGYPRALVWQVAADTRGQLPLVMLGKGVFTGITRPESTLLAQSRVTSAALLMMAALWIPLSFPWVAVLGFTAVLRDVFAWSVLLAPPLVLAIAGLRTRLREYQIMRKFRLPEAVQHETSAQIAGWSRLNGQLGMQRPKSKSTLELRLAMGGAWLAAFFLLIPLALSGLTTIIPRFTSSSGPSGGDAVRSGALSALDHYRLPADSSITAADAGRALHALSMMGRTDSASPLLQRPSVELPPVFADRNFSGQINPHSWQDSLFKVMGRGLAGSQGNLIVNAARHPSNELLTRIARAPAIDIASTRWNLGLSDTVPLFRLPDVYMSSIRDAAHAHVARAAVQLQSGKRAAADTTLREIISAGFVVRNAPSMMDAVVGTLLIRTGANAMASFNEATGNLAEAGRIRGVMYAADVAAYNTVRGRQSIEDLRRYVLVRSNPIASRWETFVLLQTAAPCLSFYSGIFGPDAEHKEWVTRARTALVTTARDSVYFAMAVKGAGQRTAVSEPRCAQVLRMYRPMFFGY